MLIWDTGAPGTFIQEMILTKDKDIPFQRVVSQKFMMGGEDFGPLELTPFEFTGPPGVDGFLGHNFFADKVVCVDFPDKAFRIR